MAEKTRKARVTDENRREAQALKAIYDSEPHHGKPRGLTQAAFGAEYKIGAQSVVWQYLNAHIPLNLRAAAAFAAGLGCKISDFSPRLAEEASSLGIAKPLAVPEKILSFLDLDRTEAQLVALYRDLGEEKRAEVMQLANRLHNQEHPDTGPANPYGRAIKAAKAER